MPVCAEVPWGGPFHGPHGFGRGRGRRGGFGFGGCGRGAFMGWGARMGPWGFWGHGPHHGPPHCPPHHGPPLHHPPHHGHHHHPPPPHHGHPHHPPPPPHHPPHCPPHHGPHHGPHHEGPGGPPGHLGGCCGGPGGGPMRDARCGRGFGSRVRGRMGPWRWGPPGMGPRRWHCRPGALDGPFDDIHLAAMFLNFDLPIFSRDGDTGEDEPPAAAAPSAPEPEEPAAETNVIRIDTRRFSPDDIRVSFSGGELRVAAVHMSPSGEEVTLRRSVDLRPGSKVTAKLGADGFLYIRAEEPAARDVHVEVV